MTVLVYGATGTQGGPVARRLLERGTPVRAVARSESAAATLAAMGAEVVDADLRDPASLAAATKGVDAVFVQLPASVSADLLTGYTRAALTAVATAGAPHTVITTSSVAPAAPTGVAYADAKLRIVELAGELTPHAVLLHPGIYLDNLAGPLRPAIDEGVLPYPIPAEVPVSWLSADDAAAFAVAALDRPDLAGRRFPLGGGEALTGPALAALLTATLDRPVRYQEITPDEFGAQLAPFLGEPVAQQIAAFYAWKGTAGSALLNPELAATTAALGTSPTAVRDWIAANLA
jgi:NAD(P)H dehydrogenase (quinone)